MSTQGPDTNRPRHPMLPKEVEFERLPRPVQDRFVRATGGAASPAPVLFRSAPRTTAWVCVGASAVLAIVAVLVLKAGWGDVSSPVALHGKGMLGLDVLLFAGAAYGIVHAAAILRSLDGLPYEAGTYLFPACLVEARGPVLRVWPTTDAAALETRASPTPALALRMRDGGRVVVRARSVKEVAVAEDAIVSLRPELMRALEAKDDRALAELDPLHVSRSLGPSEPMKLVVPLWIRFDYVLAAAIGVALGLTFGTSRNATSDEAMYRAVAAAATIPTYQQYLSQGGKHGEEVRDVLLARAELKEAEAQGTVEAVLQFAQAHPTAKIRTEVDAALQRALEAQLEKARRLGTVAGLADFQKVYGPVSQGRLDAEIAAAKHALYAQALADWQKKVQPDPSTTAFVAGLLAWAEKSREPVIDARFDMKPSKTLGDADKQVTSSSHYPGPDALPSHYLTADAMKGREQRVLLDLTQAFERQFPDGLLSVRTGERPPRAPSTGSDVPTLVVTYSPEWAFTTTVSNKPDTVFPGLNFTFDATFASPGGPGLVLRSQTLRAPQPWNVKFEAGQSREDYEGRVYDAMIDDAFDQLEKKLTSALF